jgi:MOB kinase activator 1
MKPNKTKNTDQQQPQNINNNTDLMKYATVTLGSGNLKQAVILPEGEDLNEWIAANSN